MKLIKKSFIVLVILITSCSNSIINEQVEDYSYNTKYFKCKAIIENFKFPSDFNICDSLRYICSNDPVASKNLKIKLILVFKDLNFEIYNYEGSDMKLLYDIKNKLFLCIKIKPGKYKFSSNNLVIIFILNKSAFPLYLIENSESSDQIQINKFNYSESNFVSETVNINANFNFSELTYSNILFISNQLLSGKFTYSGIKYEYDDYFRETPYWTEGF